MAASLRHLHPKPVIKTYPKHTLAMSKNLPWILGRRTAKEDQGLIVHIPLELACLVMPPGHLSLQVLGLLLALANLHSESSGHRLCHDLQILLPPELALQEVDPLLGVGALLMSQVTLYAEPLYGLEQFVTLLR